ncbi:hypothetical protein XELAEV_18035527mg [Xenopus laevis]|uniref:Uncharacterized protein n=1 Tax=Xenopus laevis TaxID=8355 RepID=A0A974CFX3_XENLA|nr:hypothetical protein XELAEV_18035527mg [Xenopus laevis]
MCTRWQEISNKCSIDYMILTIECLDTEIKDLSGTLESVKVEVSKKLGAARAEAVLAEHRDILSDLQAEITERKRRKFQRDSRDYESGQIYTWREERNRHRPRRSSDGVPAYPNIGERVIRDAPKLSEHRTKDHRGDRRPPHSGTRQPRDLYLVDSSPYTSTEEEGPSSNRETQPFLGAGPNYQHTAARKTNPRLPIVREAYSQRQKNFSSNNKRLKT